ncbi:beta-glucoside-specific PTS transporter subunit IIABC [Anaerostipes sp.]|uniref:beta-glucoside-specific PTS transporter subunit IIABC n=1 Tax=Anaerostipes sp. TaxID=1872530 RepID=UPI002579535A|nr:beta-glucoside-specific PTS transporter subunit IIABC [Anaerostipes sp.]
MTNKQLANEILKKVGGKENIITYSHCSTRLRFDLKDSSVIDKTGLEQTEGVLSIMNVAGQTQIILGSQVQYIYEELQTLLPQGDSSAAKPSEHKKKKGFWGTALEIISSLFTPLIDVLIGAGILKGILSICTATGLLTSTDGTYQILNAAGDSLYYFLPVVLAITCSKRLKTNLFVSVTIAGALLYPNLTALYDAGTAITFLGIPVHLTAFKSSVFPIIFAILLLSYVEKALKKLLPDSIRSRIAPFFSLLIVVPITIIIFGPLGSMLSDAIANFYMNLYDFNPIIAGGFIGAIAQILVIFGIHWGLFPIIFSNIEKFGFDTILAVFGPSIIAQSGAAFGVWMKTKNKRLKQIASPAAIMGFFGISEPAIYGITLKYRKAFACAVVGGGIGGAISGACGARALAVAVAAVPTFPAYFGTGFTGFVVAYFGAFLISAVLTYFIGFNDTMIPDSEKDIIPDNTTQNNTFPDSGNAITLKMYAPASGKVLSLKKVADPAFASEALGKGAAVIPEDNKIFSPIAGVISAVYPTKHAYGITGKNNEEILIHIGIDTVKLNGRFFKSYVKPGDIVIPGDLIAEADINAIKQAGYDPTIMIIDTSHTEHRQSIILQKDHVTAKKPFVRIESI